MTTSAGQSNSGGSPGRRRWRGDTVRLVYSKVVHRLRPGAHSQPITICGLRPNIGGWWCEAHLPPRHGGRWCKTCEPPLTYYEEYS